MQYYSSGAGLGLEIPRYPWNFRRRIKASKYSSWRARPCYLSTDCEFELREARNVNYSWLGGRQGGSQNLPMGDSLSGEADMEACEGRPARGRLWESLGIPWESLGIPEESFGIPRESKKIPRESLGIPKASLGIPKEFIGIPRAPQES